MRKKLNDIFNVILFMFIVVSMIACSPRQNQDGFSVFFESAPNLNDPQILFQGIPVGSVKSSSKGGFFVVKLIVTLENEFVRNTGNNLAFFVRDGHLEAAKLSTYGLPLRKDTPLCGFNSSIDLTWFKIKTLIGDRISAAEQRARKLKERYSMVSAS